MRVCVFLSILALTIAEVGQAQPISRVVGWGYNGYYGYLWPPDSVNGTSGTASAISGGYSRSCAIQAGTGNAVCWGDDAYGRASPPDSVDGTSGTASAISAGGYHGSPSGPHCPCHPCHL